MKQIAIYVLLLVHLNFSVFIPQFEERDLKSKNGVAIDDINSLSEFIYEVVLNHKDATPEDEDNDHARDFHILKITTYYCQNVITIKNVVLPQRNTITKHVVDEEKVRPIYFEIPSPPPKR